MIYGFIPWNDLWQEGFSKNFPLPTFADFYFPEAATLFLLMAVVIGLIAKLGEEGTVTTIVAGAADFLGAGLIIVLARGITVLMKNAYMTDTVLHWMENSALGQVTGGVRCPRVPRQPADRLSRAVVVRSRSAGHAHPRAARRLRRRLPRRHRDGVPIGLGARQPDHTDLGRDQGWPRPPRRSATTGT